MLFRRDERVRRSITLCFRETLSNNEGSDEMEHNAAFYEGLHSL